MYNNEATSRLCILTKKIKMILSFMWAPSSLKFLFWIFTCINIINYLLFNQALMVSKILSGEEILVTETSSYWLR